MTITNGQLVEVRVLDYSRNPLRTATVTLTLVSEAAKRVRLKYDRTREAFRAEGVPSGPYWLRVRVRSFEPDEREVEVAKEPVNTVFILGTKGMPYYYRGRMKVPFVPRDDLVGICTQPLSASPEEAFLNRAQRLGLEAIEIEAAKADTNIHVYRLPPGATWKSMEPGLRELQQSRDIQYVGLVVELSDEGVSFLSSELVVKFKPEITRNEVARMATAHRVKVLRQLPYSQNAYQLEASGAMGYEVLDIANAFVETGKVEYAEPNLVVSTVDDQVVPGDFLYNCCQGLAER